MPDSTIQAFHDEHCLAKHAVLLGLNCEGGQSFEISFVTFLAKKKKRKKPVLPV